MDNEKGENSPEINNPNPVRKPKKRINGIVIITLVFIVILISTYQSGIERVHCDANTLATNPKVIMLGTWWCPYCSQARRYLHEQEVNYCEYDIEKSAVGKKLYDDSNGSAIPVLIIGKYLLQGFDKKSIDQALILLEESDEPSR